MNIYILRRKEVWEPWYDSAFGFVVRASSEKEARQFAAKDAGDEGSESWIDATKTTCDILTCDGESGVIIRDFWAA